MSTINNAQLQALVANLTTRAPKATFVVNGVTYTSSKIATLAASVITARSSTLAAKGELANSRAQTAGVEDEAIPILGAVRSSLVSMFGNDTSAQADLLVAPRKAPRRLTVEERAAAVAKNLATRQARGTTSKQQKAKVKGNVTGVVVTPVTSQVPATTSSAATPSNVAAVPASASPATATVNPVTAAVAPTAAPAPVAGTATTLPALVAGGVGTPTGH